MFRPQLLTTLPLALALGACAPADDGAVDAELDESELAAPCALGTTCPTSVLALEAVEPGTSSTGALRNNLAFVFAPGTGSGHFAQPRAFRRKTLRPMTLSAGTSVRLAGNAAGDAPFGVDDNILVEVLAEDGTIVDSVTAGSSAALARAQTPIRHVGIETWQGDRFVVGANDVDLGGILPRDKTFRVRLSALDHGGAARVTDVFLVSSPAAVPPPVPPAVDPFDPASCSGARITRADAVARIAAGTTSADISSVVTVRSRTRTCNDTTGCGAWTSTDQIPYTFVWSDPREGAKRRTEYTSLGTSGYGAGARFVLRPERDSTQLYLDIYANASGNGFVIGKPLIGGAAMYPAHAGPCGGAYCNKSWPFASAYGARAEYLSNGLVTNHCYLLGGTYKVSVDAKLGTRQEYETRIHGTF